MKLNQQLVHIKKWLLPFSWLYGNVVSARNKFFKWGIYKQKKYSIPIICVGNISAGGTGKTPHTEYLIRLLKGKYRVAVLSRGYKRKTRGFILSTIDSTSREIGDEPFQIKQKFPDIMVAVDKKRCNGIEKLLSLKTPPEVIILDDGYQHRYVKPSYSIILSDYNRPFYEDKLLPAGRLREHIEHVGDANDIIITKCPDTLQPIDYRIISNNVNAFPFQGLYFTNFKYTSLRRVFGNRKSEEIELKALKNKDILLVTGIASPKLIISKLSEYSKNIVVMNYSDHHIFSNGDIKDIKTKFNKIKSDEKIIIVTEKDAARIKNIKNIGEDFKFYFYYLPVEVSFLENDYQNEFNKKILDHVRENSRNS